MTWGDTAPVLNGGGKRNSSRRCSILDRVSYVEVNHQMTNTVPSGTSYAATGIRVNGGNNIATFAIFLFHRDTRSGLEDKSG
ncbi:hypothetical protein [Sphingobacterium detergens]